MKYYLFLTMLVLLGCNEVQLKLVRPELPVPAEEIPLPNALAPVAINVTLTAVAEATATTVTLNYNDSNAEPATACSITGTNNIEVTAPCSCDVSGVCTVGIRGVAGYSGSASFDYVVEKNGVTSNSAVVSVPVYSATSFVTKWKTDNAGSLPNQITLPLSAGGAYNFTVDWGDGTVSSITSWNDVDVTHNYASPGTYTVIWEGSYSSFSFSGHPDKEKILDVTSWGSNQWSDMSYAFNGCANLDITATNAPDLSNVVSLRGAFSGATNFNGDIGHWDVSTITDMAAVFQNATSFNQDILPWNVSNVTNMDQMFEGASSFNQSLGGINTFGMVQMGWDIDNVTTATGFDTGAVSWVESKPNFSMF